MINNLDKEYFAFSYNNNKNNNSYANVEEYYYDTNDFKSNGNQISFVPSSNYTTYILANDNIKSIDDLIFNSSSNSYSFPTIVNNDIVTLENHIGYNMTKKLQISVPITF